jgi:predicted helicase
MISIADKITEAHITASPSIGSIAPLYLYQNAFGKEEASPNFDKANLNKLTRNLTVKPTPLQVFDYCYGALYDPGYREKYDKFLKRDYPRVPVIENETAFGKCISVGGQLRRLHLMQTNADVAAAEPEFVGGDSVIGTVKYINGELFINKTAKITGVAENVWNYYVCGYQVLAKWFKSRKGEAFDFEKFQHIRKVVRILNKTIELQKELTV